MKKGLAIVLFLIGAGTALFAQSLPVSGALEKTDWSLPKTGLVALLPAAAQDTAEVTADKVAWSVRDLTQGLMSDGGQFLFNKAGALYQIALVRMYNLETGNAAQALPGFAGAAADDYTKKLGKPDADDVKTVNGQDSALTYGTILWKANSRRAVGPTLKIEIAFFASGTFVFFTETCTNTAVSPE